MYLCVALFSISSSSSRTILDRNLYKRVLQDEDAESSTNLDGLEIPNLKLCNSFDFMNGDILPDVFEGPRESPPLSTQTIAYRENVMRESLELGKSEFLEGRNFNYVSHRMNHAVNWIKGEILGGFLK